MKKNFIVLAVMAIIAVPAFAQYWTTRSTYDPFRNGDKSIGLSVGTGMWFGPSDAISVGSDYGTNKGRVITNVSRPPLNPSIALHYKRVLQGNTVDWGNSLFLSYSRWGGKIEGNNSGNDTASVKWSFTDKYNWSELLITDMFYIMVPIGERIRINAGVGLSIGMCLKPKSEYTRSDGYSSSNFTMEFFDLLISRIDAMVGVDYALSDSFSVNANIMAWPLDVFGALTDHKNMRSAGEGLYVNTKLPFQLTAGFTYSL